MQVRNPIAFSHTYVVPVGVPIQVSNPNLPKFGGHNSPQFNQAREYARAGNSAELTKYINTHIQSHSTNLPQLFSAVNALHGVQNPSYTQLRSTTLQLAQTQIASGAHDPTPYVVVAQMSLQDQNSARFNETTRTMMAKFPDSEYSHYFQGVQHLQNREFQEAEASLNRARELGMPEESIAELMKVAIDNQKWIWEYAEVLCLAVLLWLVGLLALYTIGKVLSKRTLAHLHSDPEGSIAGDVWQRAIYRRVIAVAGLYYYLSLPMVLLISIALPVSLGYAMLMVPYFNILLVIAVLIVGLGGIITAISGIRTAFLRVQPLTGGRILASDELPELWKLVREVAESVGTRPVEQIRLVSSTDVCVLEKGSWWARRRDKAERILVLGLGALYGMKTDALRAILAHEYGHFQNRDTAGGDIALRVNLAMTNFAQAIIKRGKVRWWDLAIHFLRLYHYIFRQLTFGASRLQEVYADRLAVQQYGSAAFREGLTHVIRRSVEYQWALSKSLDNAVKAGSPAVAFFDITLVPELHEREQIETAIKEILSRETDASDSHPSPKDRFELAERLDPFPRRVTEEEFWEIVASHEGIIGEMNSSVEALISLESSLILQDLRDGVRVTTSVLRREFHPLAMFDRARLYLTLGEYDKAVDDLLELRNAVPDEGHIHYLLGLAYKRLREYDLAIVEFEYLASQSELDERGIFSRHAKFGPDEQVTFLLSLAECLAKVGDHRGALERYTQVLELRSTSLPALVGRATAHAALGEHEQAQAAFESAGETWPGTRLAVGTGAWVE
jgi:tetratricopeptide (TPR) repeat protein